MHALQVEPGSSCFRYRGIQQIAYYLVAVGSHADLLAGARQLEDHLRAGISLASSWRPLNGQDALQGGYHSPGSFNDGFARLAEFHPSQIRSCAQENIPGDLERSRTRDPVRGHILTYSDERLGQHFGIDITVREDGLGMEVGGVTSLLHIYGEVLGIGVHHLAEFGAADTMQVIPGAELSALSRK